MQIYKYKNDIKKFMIVLTCGFLVVDIIAADIPRIALPGEVIFTPIHLEVGGHPANVAIDLRKLGLKEIGVVGTIGEDLFGDYIENILKNYGINTSLQRKAEIATTSNMILVVKGEDRRFHLNPGASLHLDPNFVRNILNKSRPKIFYSATGITGIDLEIHSILKETDCLTFLDLVKPYNKDWDFILPALKYVDIFHCNELEAIEITGELDINLSLKKLINFGPKVVIVTGGSQGARLINKNIEISQKPFKVKTVDPTGAGDAFSAGIISKLIELDKDISKITQEELAGILAYGQAAGAVSCTGIGATRTITLNGVNRIFEEQKENILRETVIKSF